MTELSDSQVEHRYRPILPCVSHTGVSADRLGLQEPPGPPEAKDENSRRLTLALVVISASQLMVVLDATIVTVALPSIRKALHFSAVNLEWTISAYTLAFGGFLLLGGRLGDVFGRRRMFIIGISVFTLASLAGGFADYVSVADHNPRNPRNRRCDLGSDGAGPDR